MITFDNKHCTKYVIVLEYITVLDIHGQRVTSGDKLKKNVVTNFEQNRRMFLNETWYREYECSTGGK